MARVGRGVPTHVELHGPSPPLFAAFMFLTEMVYLLVLYFYFCEVLLCVVLLEEGYPTLKLPDRFPPFSTVFMFLNYRDGLLIVSPFLVLPGLSVR